VPVARGAVQPLREFLAGVDTESLVDVPEVVLDRLGAEEQRGRGFPRRLPPGEQQRDLQLLRRQIVEGARVPGPARFAGGRELGAGPLSPGPGVEAVEGVHRRAELLAGQHPVPGPAQPLPVGQPGARGFEHVGGLLMQGDRTLEIGGEAGVLGQHPLAAQRPGQRPGLPLASAAAVKWAATCCASLGRPSFR
jgi:hypothetical protein